MARRSPSSSSRRHMTPGQGLCATFETCGFHRGDDWVGRFLKVHHIADTLQGYTAKSFDEKDRVYRCIKAASRSHVQAGVSLRGTRVKEAFQSEQALLVRISSMPDVPASICRYIVGWDSATVHYYAMEYVSHGALFHFMKNILHADPALAPTVQERVYMGKTRTRFLPDHSPYKRLKVIAGTMAQIVDAVAWLHSKSIVHLDLSLENIMRANSDITRPKIKIIDFGVAVDFSDRPRVRKYGRNVWLHDQDVGKPGYKANEVRQCASSRVRQRRGLLIPYDAEAAEIWTFGTMIYMFVFRAYPFQQHADVDDPFFVTILQGQLRQWFADQGWSCWLTRSCFDLLNRIWQPEATRITMRELVNHPFIQMGREYSRRPRSMVRSHGEEGRRVARDHSVIPPEMTGSRDDDLVMGLSGVANIQKQATEQISTVDLEENRLDRIEQGVERMQVSVEEGGYDHSMAGSAQSMASTTGGMMRQRTSGGMSVDEDLYDGGQGGTAFSTFPSLQRQDTHGSDGDVEMRG